ncbi:MAG: ATP-grasp domain-containing protein [Planctomycetes bacterium]|nr:ATP-grasp domain-containing protein [Planctomycetota bacterium]
MNVLMLSPGFPDDMPYFTRGLAQVGARVFGVGDQPMQAIPAIAREALTDHLRIGNLWDEQKTVREVQDWMRGRTIDRVECLWEPGMVLAARMREAFRVPGLDVERSITFRDKVRMKETLAKAGLRMPGHARCKTKSEVRAAVERFGFPAIVKPIAGAGSADTHRLDGKDDVERALSTLDHVAEVTVEEFVEGEEFTYDTISIDGRPAYDNVSWYRPKPLVARQNPWISGQAIALRDLERKEIRVGRELGLRVLQALGFESGMSHMEWFRNGAGEAVFGEIGGRAPGGRLTHVMNYACNLDLFLGWAEAVCHKRFTQPIDRRFNAAVVFKRAEGEGTIRRIEGLDGLLARYGEHVAHIDLVRVGEQRRDWRQVVTGDGWIVVRHPELETTMRMADQFGTDLRIYAA